MAAKASPATKPHEPGTVLTTHKDGTVVLAMPFSGGASAANSFSRADLIFDGVDHSDMSYEVRVFLNNPKANAKIPRSPENGYAGKFVVFGHGGCSGQEGHCAIQGAPTGLTAADIEAERPHPLTPITQVITITDRLKELLNRTGDGLETLTLVPIKVLPDKSDAGSAKGLFKYQRVSLQTYR